MDEPRAPSDLEAFVAGAAHDLRAPLQTALGHLDLLEPRLPKGDPLAREGLDAARDALLRMRGLLTDMLDYAGSVRPEPTERVEVGPVARAVMADLDALLRQEKATVQLGQLPVVKGHAKHVARILQNLLANAVKYHGEKAPVVRVGAHRAGADWVVDVADNGRGIQADEMQRLFRPFVRLPSSRGVDGNGLGLATSARLASAMHGRLWATSTPGRGTTFHLALPAA